MERTSRIDFATFIRRTGTTGYCTDYLIRFKLVEDLHHFSLEVLRSLLERLYSAAGNEHSACTKGR